MNWLSSKRLKLLDWAPSSPDMNIIEHVWNRLDHMVRSRNPLPSNKVEFWAALQEEWQNIDKAYLTKLYESMPYRVEALKKAGGGHTKY